MTVEKTVNQKKVRLEIIDITDFADAGQKSYVAGRSDWSAAARKHWRSEGNEDDTGWIGNIYLVRFFVQYVASPSGGNSAYFYEGRAYLTGVSTGTPHDAVVDQSLNFQGQGALTLTTQASSWP